MPAFLERTRWLRPVDAPYFTPRSRLRGWREELALALNLPTIRTELKATLIRDGKSIELGVLSRRVVTTAGVNYIASTFTNGAEPETMNFHDSGTGTGAEAVGDTGLGTKVETGRATGTQSNPNANEYRTVGTISYTGTHAITEHGVFSASSAGTLLDRSVFSPINVLNADSIQFTYTIAFTAGG
jgi:hypothetical protein